MNTAKDANGVDIKVGDRVRHRMLPCDVGIGGHGFAGAAEVTRFIGAAHVECELQGGFIVLPANVVKV